MRLEAENIFFSTSNCSALLLQYSNPPFILPAKDSMCLIPPMQCKNSCSSPRTMCPKVCLPFPNVSCEIPAGLTKNIMPPYITCCHSETTYLQTLQLLPHSACVFPSFLLTSSTQKEIGHSTVSRF